MPVFPRIALFLLLCASADAQSLGVIVEASGTPSRDAHFNWKFQSSGGGEVRMGQFACGSYWVAPADGDSGVTLLSLTGNPSWNDSVSCDADPIPESHGLLDGSNNYGSYNSAENIVPRLPLTFSPPENSCNSLVAAMQRNEAETSPGGTKSIVGEVVDAYCVVTVMPAPPANGGSDMIRPNITGASKEFLTWDDFDLSRLPTYPFITGKSAQAWQECQERWRACTEVFGGLHAEIAPGNWKYFSEGGRAFRAHILIPDYGAGMTRAFDDDLLALFSNSNAPEQKQGALASMLSFGLDIYHARYDYGTGLRKAWLSGAGQQAGKFLPAVLLASLLKDETKAHELRKVAIYNHGQDEALIGPQELRQITRGVTGVLLWGDGTPFIRNGNNLIEEDRRYWSNSREASCYDTAIGDCNAGAGKKTIADPYGYIDGPAEKPGTSYMSVSFGAVRALAAAMILMPEIRSVVNTDAPIEYVDRVLRHGLWTYPDPVAPVSETDQADGCDPWRGGIGCSEFGLTWGPDPDDIRFAIEDGTGRFVSIHGQAVSIGSSYEVSRAKDNWSSIIAMYDGNTYEDNAVPLGTLVAPEITFETGSNPKAHLLSPNPDAEIRYTIDGTDPDESSALYTDPVPVIQGTEIRAKAYLTNKTPSAIRTRVFDFSVPPPDSEAPGIPTGLTASNPTASTIDLNWNPSTDNIGVAGYKVFIDGAYSTSIIGTSIQAIGLSPNTQYTFNIVAYDASGNESAPTAGISATTTADSGNTSASVVSVEVSAEQSGNEGALSIDGDTATRWAAAGDPQWIQWELDQEYTLVSISLGFHNGSSRSYAFEIEVSLNQVDWNNVYSGQSSGQTTSLESFDVVDAPARFIRYTGHGSTANTWNSLTEVEFETTGAERRWGNGVALPDGHVNTETNLGWLYLTEGNWAWSYSLSNWIYAPDPGPATGGAWIYFSK